MNKNQKIVISIVAIVAIIIVIAITFMVTHNAAAPSLPSGSSATSTPSSTMGGGSPTSTLTPTSSTSTPPVVVVRSHYPGASFSFDYPSTWTITNYRPFAMDSFGGKYAPGNLLPANGAELDIATTSAEGGANVIIQTELMHVSNLSKSTITVNGTSCVKARYTDEYVAGHTLQTAAVYCSRGTELWKIYFSYNINDTAAATHEADFKTIIGSMKLL